MSTVTGVSWGHEEKPGSLKGITWWIGGRPGGVRTERNVSFEKKRRMNNTSLSAFVFQSYVLFSRSNGNFSLTEGEKKERIPILGGIFKIGDTRYSFAAYKKRKRDRDRKMLFV